jgi:hypothetical protein
VPKAGNVAKARAAGGYRPKYSAAAARLTAPTVADVADAFLAECAAKLRRSTVVEYRRLLGIARVQCGPVKGTERVGVRLPGANPGSHYTDTARVWDAVRPATGLPDVRLHDLRHTFASVAASGGLTLLLIGALLGHTDTSTTGRCAHLIECSRKRAAELTSAAVAAALAGDAPTNGSTGRLESPAEHARILSIARHA